MIFIPSNLIFVSIDLYLFLSVWKASICVTFSVAGLLTRTEYFHPIKSKKWHHFTLCDCLRKDACVVCLLAQNTFHHMSPKMPSIISLLTSRCHCLVSSAYLRKVVLILCFLVATRCHLMSSAYLRKMLQSCVIQKCHHIEYLVKDIVCFFSVFWWDRKLSIIFSFFFFFLSFIFAMVELVARE